MQCAWAILSSVVCLAVQCFSILSHKRHNFWKRYSSQSVCVCVLIFSTTFVWNISHCKNWARYDPNCTALCMCSTCCYVMLCYRLILMKSECYRRTFEKYSNIKFHGNLFSGSWAVPCGRTDMRKLTVVFCKRTRIQTTANNTARLEQRLQ